MSALPSILARFLALSWPERRTVLAAMALLPLFWLALRLVGLQRLQARLYRAVPKGTAQPALDAHAWVEHAGVPVNDRDDIGATFHAFEGAVAPGRFLA